MISRHSLGGCKTYATIFLMMVALSTILLMTSMMLVLRSTDELTLTRSTMATSMTRSIEQFFQVLTTCSDVWSTYHLEYRFGYFASVAWLCDYVACLQWRRFMATAMVFNGGGDGNGDGNGNSDGDSDGNCAATVMTTAREQERERRQ